MAEKQFTRYFKSNLADSLQRFFNDNGINLTTKTEYITHSGTTENRIDIGICIPDNEQFLLGIEIEVISCKEQIFKNYTNFRNWVHSSPNRKGALLHIISSNSRIANSELTKILNQSYSDMNKGNEFYFEFFRLQIDDKRKYQEMADDLVNIDWEFDVRLASLINKVFGARYLW